MRSSSYWLVALIVVAPLLADGPGDNSNDTVRPVPPPGVPVPDDIRSHLASETARLRGEIDSLRVQLAGKSNLLARLPDVEIFHKSVDWALRYDEFFRSNEFTSATLQLQTGFERAASLREGAVPWNGARGLVVRGYRSRIDDSIQPYGLVVPPSYSLHSGHRWRLDFWFHGRGETLSELAFLQDRMKNPGEFAPADTIVLHLYGRYCNGNRFAGETDFWEALADVRSLYPIDEDRMIVRGFSLGGAACWHFATHYAAMWAAAAPGAGFSETEEFLHTFQGETLNPASWERKLWRLYDSTEHALNVTMVPLVAYSGERDRQIQAARAMEHAMAGEGLSLTHLIGPATEHRYEPATKARLSQLIDSLAARGRDPLPRQVRFVTHSLRYNQMAWVRLDGLQEHWEPARVEAAWRSENHIAVQTRNVTAMSFEMPTGLSPFSPLKEVVIDLDGQSVTGPRAGSDRSWQVSVHREGDAWKVGPLDVQHVRKKPGLQGPIDDAFMDAFMMVLPTSPAMNDALGAWVKAESAHAIEHWRKHFRGDALSKDDRDITPEDIRSHNLVLWGDPKSNALLGRIADRLPIRWSADGIFVGKEKFGAGDHVPVLIYPNPLNPERYVVINSGFIFCEYDYLNNARQTPKLPDWAVLDLRRAPTPRRAGEISAAGFFGENWELK